MTSHLFIPDVQYKEGVPYEHLIAAGNMIAEMRPEVIVCAGDFADMPSLSSYDIGKRSFEGRRYQSDIRATKEAMAIMLEPMNRLNHDNRRNKKRLYSPTMILTLGNHEERINRVVNDDARLHGTISTRDLGYEEAGWTVVPYMTPIIIDGVAYCHFFYNKLTGRPFPNARTTLLREHVSCTSGHQQKLEMDIQYRGDGSSITSIIAGAFYLHDEDYKGHSGNEHWRGLVYKDNVRDGMYDPSFIQINNLIRDFT